jgi:hypothetical protein
MVYPCGPLASLILQESRPSLAKDVPGVIFELELALGEPERCGLGEIEPCGLGEALALELDVGEEDLGSAVDWEASGKEDC